VDDDTLAHCVANSAGRHVTVDLVG